MLHSKTAFVLIDAALVGTTPQMQSSSPPSTTGTDRPTVGGDAEEEDGMKHLQQVSVAYFCCSTFLRQKRKVKKESVF